jgi:predicted enzyme related to lactoylglutathione lyase
MTSSKEQQQQTMSATVNLTWGSVNIDAADPVSLADFWGKVLGHPVRPGMTPGTMTVDPPDSGSGLGIVIVRAAEPVKIGGGFCPNLFTDHHDEETERLTGLGAEVVNEVYLTSDDHPTIRMTVLADPEGNPFNLATLQSDWCPGTSTD